MGSIWKIVITFVVILLITITGVSITAVNAETAAAGDYLESTAAVIRESNYSGAVIDQCIGEAEENGYLLEVEVYREPVGVCYARLCLHYRYQLAVFQVSEWKKREKIV